MKNFFDSLKKRYHYAIVVFKELVKTDFQLRYQGSFLGMVWSVLKPLMLFAVMYVVFVKFLKFSDGPRLPDFIAVWYLLVELLSESTSMGMQSIVAAVICCVRFISRTTLLWLHHYGFYDFSRHQPARGDLLRFLRTCALHMARIARAAQHHPVVLPWPWRSFAARVTVRVLP